MKQMTQTLWDRLFQVCWEISNRHKNGIDNTLSIYLNVEVKLRGMDFFFHE